MLFARQEKHFSANLQGQDPRTLRIKQARRNLIYLFFIFLYISVLVHVLIFLYFCQPIMSHIFPLVLFEFCNRFIHSYLASA